MNLNELGLEPTDNKEILLLRMRNQRDRLLSQSDWAMVSDAPTDKRVWGAYRQTLRDFPSTWTPNEIADFPDLPSQKPY